VKFVAVCVYVQDGKFKLGKLLTKRHSSQTAGVTSSCLRCKRLIPSNFHTRTTTTVKNVHGIVCLRLIIFASGAICNSLTYCNTPPYLTTQIFVCTYIKLLMSALSGDRLLVDERLDSTRTSSPTTLDHWHCIFLGCKRRIRLGKEIRFLNQSFTAGRCGLRSPPTSARSGAFNRISSL